MSDYGGFKMFSYQLLPNPFDKPFDNHLINISCVINIGVIFICVINMSVTDIDIVNIGVINIGVIESYLTNFGVISNDAGNIVALKHRRDKYWCEYLQMEKYQSVAA